MRQVDWIQFLSELTLRQFSDFGPFGIPCLQVPSIFTKFFF